MSMKKEHIELCKDDDWYKAIIKKDNRLVRWNYKWILSLGISFVIGAIFVALGTIYDVNHLSNFGIVLPIWNLALYFIYSGLKLVIG